MIVLVGSQNPVKTKAVEEAFSKYFGAVDVMGIKVESKVSNQPIDSEVFEGAHNRALELKRLNKKQVLGAKFFIGIEGGIIKYYSKWFVVSVMCVVDDKSRVGYGTSPHFEIPYNIVEQLFDGIELGTVMDKIMGDHNIKQKGGAISYFTKGVMDRKNLYVQGLIVSLIPFVNEDMYFVR